MDRIFSDITGVNWGCPRACRIYYVDILTLISCMALLFSGVILLGWQSGRHTLEAKKEALASFCWWMLHIFLKKKNQVLKPFDPASRCYSYMKPPSHRSVVSSAGGWGWWPPRFWSCCSQAWWWMPDWDVAVVGLFRAPSLPLGLMEHSKFHSFQIILLACCWLELLT